MAGAGFKDFTVGQILTSQEVDEYLMQQSVMVFATTTARDSAIAAPSRGMVAYISSNDTSEGLYTYNGTSWRKGPGWNAPWGYLTTLNGSAATTVLRAGAGAGSVDFVSGSYTHVNNRRIRITAAADSTWTTSIGTAWRLTQDSTTLLYMDQPVQSTFGGLTGVAVATTTASSMSYKYTLMFGGSVSNVTVSQFTPYIILEDIGPSGAPV